MLTIEHSYAKLLESLVAKAKFGGLIKDRTGVGTFNVFGANMESASSVNDGIVSSPALLQCKRVHFKSVKEELLWMLSGDTDVKTLQDKGVTIWDEWAMKDGTIGKGYGYQWRNFGGVDQIKELEKTLQSNPTSRRMIVTAWNPAELDQMALPPCHMTWQVNTEGNQLHMHLYQRSADTFLGVPFNIAAYNLLGAMLAHVHGYKAVINHYTFANAHLYSNHVEAAEEYISRYYMQAVNDMYGSVEDTKLVIHGKHDSILDIKSEDIELVDYKPMGTIKAEVAV